MKQRISRALAFLLLLLFASAAARAGCHAVTLTGSGARSGRDWNNACAGFAGACAPQNMERGGRYYVAAGKDYPPVTFNTAERGTERITVLRATAQEHCADAGWRGAYDGEVRWTAPVTFATGYWTFDGITGEGAGTVAYGFRFVSDQARAPFLRVERQVARQPRAITVRHVEVDGVNCCGIADTAMGVAAFYYPGDCRAGIATGEIALEYDYFHDTKRDPVLVYGVAGLLLDHVYLARNRSTRENHGQGIALTGARDVTIRNSVFEDITGTAEITFIGYCTSEKIRVYGNRFFYSQRWPQAKGHTGVSYMFEAIGPGGSVTDLEFFQNTIAHFDRPHVLNAGFYPDVGAHGYKVFNNLWVENSALTSAVEINGSTHDYNSLLATPLAFNWKRAGHEEVRTNDHDGLLFADPQFHLARHTAPGKTLTEPYGLDAEGWPRGFAGREKLRPANWDQGAFQFSPSTGTNGER
ncbi:MAG: right-handed parallel beta-helix repeat-containing protein [Acidobacteriota bacterium]|nr:right-handed parallel beta-helix repeat-containing protein [Acidobacteriota bacterium]